MESIFIARPLMGNSKKITSLSTEYGSKFLSLNSLKFISNKFLFNNQKVKVIGSRNFKDIGVSGLVICENFKQLVISNNLNGKDHTVCKKGLLLELIIDERVFLINFSKFGNIRKRFNGLPRNVEHFVGVQ
jgi:RNase P/RNase MRP subunit p29